MHDDATRPFAPPAKPGLSTHGPLRKVRSDELLRGTREIIIEHDGREYRLRVTQNGKLILTA